MITHAPEAEQSVLGAILGEPSLMEQAQLQPEYFHSVKHQVIYRVMQHMHSKGEPTDLVSVYTGLQEVGEEIGGIHALSELAQAVPSTSESYFEHHQRSVVEAYVCREQAKAATAFAENPTSENMAEMQRRIEQVSMLDEAQDEPTLKEVLAEIADDLNPPDENHVASAVKTGFVEWDQMTSGVRDDQLYIIAARPSMGKTAFALNMGTNLAKKGVHTHIFSLEMGQKILVNRMLSNEGRVNLTKWEAPYQLFNEGDFDRATSAIAQASEWPMHVKEKGTFVSDIRSHVKKQKEKYPNEKHVVIVDYLQLMQSATNHKGNRTQEVGEISRDLKRMATELSIPVIALSQLSRGVEQRQDKRPMMSDLRDSGNIEQDADVIAFLYRDDYYDSESEHQNIVEIIIAKQRNGPVGMCEMMFMKEFQSFVNLDRRHADHEPIQSA